MITVGIDCGSKNTKVVVLKEHQITGKAKVLTGFDQEQSVEKALSVALEDAKMLHDDIKRILGTGTGKASIKMADDTINDIKAMAVGARYYFPKAFTVADVGAEEARVAKLDETGNTVDFAINEKCAAGAGTFIEAMGRALETPISEMGPLALTSDKEIPMNAQCVIFAESEAVGLIHERTPKNDISKAIHDAMAKRIASMMLHIGVNKDVVLMGGVGRNPGFIMAFKRKLNLETIYVPEHPEFGAAVGAAVAAAKEISPSI